MQEILNALVGKTFVYKTKTITITKWKKITSSYVVFTDKQTYNFFERELKTFTHELQLVRGLEIKNVPIQVKKHELKPMETEQQEIKNVPIQEDLKNVLFDTIQKLQTDKSYIQR